MGSFKQLVDSQKERKISCILKMIRNAFYFTSKALFVLKIFKFLHQNLDSQVWTIFHVSKRLD